MCNKINVCYGDLAGKYFLLSQSVPSSIDLQLLYASLSVSLQPTSHWWSGQNGKHRSVLDMLTTLSWPIHTKREKEREREDNNNNNNRKKLQFQLHQKHFNISINGQNETTNKNLTFYVQLRDNLKKYSQNAAWINEVDQNIKITEMVENKTRKIKKWSASGEDGEWFLI